MEFAEGGKPVGLPPEGCRDQTLATMRMKAGMSSPKPTVVSLSSWWR